MGQLVFQANAGGQTALVGPNPSTSISINIPATNGNMVTTGDSGTVTSTMLASSVYTAPGTIGSGTPNTGAFTTLGATGVATFSAGTVSAPAITTTGDTNTGIFFPAADTIAFAEGGAESMRIDSAGNVGIGSTSPSSTGIDTGSTKLFVVTPNSSFGAAITAVADSAGRTIRVANQAKNVIGVVDAGDSVITYGANTVHPVTFISGGAERMRITSSGQLLVNTSSVLLAGAGSIQAQAIGTGGAIIGKSSEWSTYTQYIWNATTANDSRFVSFNTEGTATQRGSIDYNRGAGVVAYNVTSDYRAKDIISPVLNSGELIDSVPVYMGKMKGATQARPMFIAHETPDYAHTGEKDAVDKDGNPVYQQMDTSILVPVLWAEIQSLRKRIAALESK